MDSLTHCYRCDARYRPGPCWMTVLDLAVGTEPPRLRKVADIPASHCPICNKPPLTTRPEEARPM